MRWSRICDTILLCWITSSPAVFALIIKRNKDGVSNLMTRERIQIDHLPSILDWGCNLFLENSPRSKQVRFYKINKIPELFMIVLHQRSRQPNDWALVDLFDLPQVFVEYTFIILRYKQGNYL
jgi:hypothetical protein